MFRLISVLVVLYLCTQISAGPPKESTKEPPAETKNESPKKTGENEIQKLFEYIQKRDHGRARKKWTYENLITESDVVLIGMFKEKKEVEFTKADTESVYNDGGSYLGIDTHFEVLGVLKANPEWKQTPKTCTVFHFAWDFKKIGFISGMQPIFVDFSIRTFSKPGIDLENLDEGIVYRGWDDSKPYKEAPRSPHLMFLKARPDGRYEPVSGQYFASLSFQTVGG